MNVNAPEKWCWSVCRSCFRCGEKGRYAACNTCSGRHDPQQRRDPYDIDDHCRCTEGVLQFRLQNGRLVIRRFLSNPFAGKVTTDAETEDERDWNSFVHEKREQFNNPTYDPVRFSDGTSTLDWSQKARHG